MFRKCELNYPSRETRAHVRSSPDQETSLWIGAKSFRYRWSHWKTSNAKSLALKILSNSIRTYCVERNIYWDSEKQNLQKILPVRVVPFDEKIWRCCSSRTQPDPFRKMFALLPRGGKKFLPQKSQWQPLLGGLMTKVFCRKGSLLHFSHIFGFCKGSTFLPKRVCKSEGAKASERNSRGYFKHKTLDVNIMKESCSVQ